MELRRCHWLLILPLFAGLALAQDSAADLYAQAEKLRLDAKTRKDAIALYERVAEMWKGSGEEAKVRLRLGQLLDLSGQREKALAEFQLGLAIAAEAKLEASLHYGTARVLVAMGQATEGIASYQKALSLRRNTGERFEQALALHNMGAAYWSLGLNVEALSAYQEALAIRRELKDETGLAYTLFGMASVQYTWGDAEKALHEYEQALAIWRKLKNPRGEADSLNGIGLMYSLLGDTRKARLHYAEALALWQKAGDGIGEAYTLSNLGMVEGTAGRASFERALKVLREKGDKRGQAYVLHNLAGLDGSFALFEESLAIKRDLGDRYGEAQTLEKLAEAYLKARRSNDALATAVSAVELQHTVGNKLGEASAEAIRSRSLLSLGKLEEAKASLDSALKQIEGLRASVVSVELRSTFFATQQRVYKDAIAVLMDLGKTQEALELSERSRARVLLDRVLAAREALPEDQSILLRERELTRDIHAQAQRLQRLSAAKPGAESAEARRNLDRLFERWSQLTNERQVLVGVEARPSIERVQREVLDGRTALVEYSLDQDRGWAWVVTTAGVRAVKLSARASIAALVRKQRAAIAAKTRDTNLDQELTRLLITPLGLGTSISRLVIVPDAPLDHLSFAAIGNLLDRLEVIDIPSASMLVALRERPKWTGRRSLQIVADPVFDAADSRLQKSDDSLASNNQSEYRRLHFSRIESSEIAKIAGVGTAKQWSGLLAEKSLLDQKTFREAMIVHLATHAQVDEIRPELSAVLFSQVDARGRPRNGHLRLYEIYRLKLAAELVVLSGCSTALGPDLSGEGTMSLTRGFLYAGAARVLATQWEVEDRATAELMRRFYERLLRGRLTAAAALRQAQLALRADARWKDPYYWAGFRLEGDWR
ncbi:MAG: CHAT domain-containing protein [Acidobacteria bacterium]|nr:CHAT domain-containing protein [Acidobacteriota bacterium]